MTIRMDIWQFYFCLLGEIFRESEAMFFNGETGLCPGFDFFSTRSWLIDKGLLQWLRLINLSIAGYDWGVESTEGKIKFSNPWIKP